MKAFSFYNLSIALKNAIADHQTGECFEDLITGRRYNLEIKASNAEVHVFYLTRKLVHHENPHDARN